MKFIFLALVLVLSTVVQADRYNAENNPASFEVIVGTKMVLHWEHLPTHGVLNDGRLGWSDTYWPSYKGGIAFRWNHPDPRPFRYSFHTLPELRKMSLAELSQLSPAELYDLAQGDYKYTLTRQILKMNRPTAHWWEGICEGWALASANYPEPAKTVVVNKHGLRIPFGSSDVKALLSAHDAYNSLSEYATVGVRCDAPGKVPGEDSDRDPIRGMPAPHLAEADNCRDVNAGAFHIVLTNMIGIHSKGLVADIDRFNDVWNQPVTGYISEILGEEALAPEHVESGIAQRIRVQTKMTYGEELQFWSAAREAMGEKNFVSKEPVTGTIHQAYRSKQYEYVLEIDATGSIVGGEWITDTRPDFLWMKRRDPRFINGKVPLSGLNTIYRPIRR